MTDVQVPPRLANRPRARGFVVPWFVVHLEDGTYDFRVADMRKLGLAVRGELCWTCGEPIGRWQVFTVGPMCAINRISSEPPSHRECAEYAAAVCPFLTQREQKRRTDRLPDGYQNAAGLLIERQPGVALLWVTREGYDVVRAPGGVLFRMGEPSECIWMCEGRSATRDEVLASIESGYPLLLAEAEREGPAAVATLADWRAVAERLVPAA